MSSQESRPEFPPAKFNVSDFVFRPDFSYSPRPGLSGSTELLVQRQRYRSALEPLLKILADSPRDQEALTLALLVLGYTRTSNVQADEALGNRYLLDQRLDPLFATCSKCGRTWAPHNCILPIEQEPLNPIGKQCWGCGYVMCRKCFEGLTACPNCQSTALRGRVYPTGRTPRQLERRNKPVAAAIVFREGPIPPDIAWLNALFEPLSPDILESAGAAMNVHPVPEWPRDMQAIAMAMAARLIGDGRIKATLNDAIGAEVRSVDGLRVYVLKLY